MRNETSNFKEELKQVLINSLLNAAGVVLKQFAEVLIQNVSLGGNLDQLCEKKCNCHGTIGVPIPKVGEVFTPCSTKNNVSVRSTLDIIGD